MSLVTESVASGDQVAAVVGMLEDTLEGCPRGLAIISLLTMSIVLQNPAISPEDLQSTIKEVSRFLCMMLEGTDVEFADDDAKKRLIN